MQEDLTKCDKKPWTLTRLSWDQDREEDRAIFMQFTYGPPTKRTRLHPQNAPRDNQEAALEEDDGESGEETSPPSDPTTEAAQEEARQGPQGNLYTLARDHLYVRADPRDRLYGHVAEAWNVNLRQVQGAFRVITGHHSQVHNAFFLRQGEQVQHVLAQWHPRERRHDGPSLVLVENQTWHGGEIIDAN